MSFIRKHLLSFRTAPESMTTPYPETGSPKPLITPAEVMLGLAIGPMLLGLIASRAVLKTTQAVGQLSEELWRGDRLPPLS